MTLFLATHHHRDRVLQWTVPHPELAALPRIVISNKDPKRAAAEVFSLDPLRTRREIGMFYDSALDCTDDLLLSLNDDVRFISPGRAN